MGYFKGWQKKGAADGEITIGVHDNFFEMGGHSLKATVLMNRIHTDFNVDITLAGIFKNPTIRGMADTINQLEASHTFGHIERAPKQEHYILSSVQRRMFMAQITNPSNTSYNLPVVVELEGLLDRRRLEEVMNEVVRRHESFRTSFELVDGTPVQRILDTVDFAIPYHDLYDGGAPGSGETPRSLLKNLSAPSTWGFRLKCVWNWYEWRKNATS